MPDPVRQRNAQRAALNELPLHRIDYVRFSGESPGVGCLCGWESQPGVEDVEAAWNQHRRDLNVRTK